MGGLTHSRDGDMRFELAALGRQPGVDQSAFDLCLERDEGGIGRDADPQRAHPATLAEMADAVELEIEAGAPDGRQRLADIDRDAAIDIADEAQREMELVRPLPPGARYATGQQG